MAILNSNSDVCITVATSVKPDIFCMQLVHAFGANSWCLVLTVIVALGFYSWCVQLYKAAQRDDRGKYDSKISFLCINYYFLVRSLTAPNHAIYILKIYNTVHLLADGVKFCLLG